MIDIKVVYRNYIPLYSGYSSFWLNRNDEIKYHLPKINRKLSYLYKVGKRIRSLPFMPFLIDKVQKIFFKNHVDSEHYDGYFFAGILPSPNFSQPYLIDFEHIYALFDYALVNEESREKVLSALTSPQCLQIAPWSRAAEQTMLQLFSEEADSLSKKSTVLYPALPNYFEKYEKEISYRYISKSSSLKLLFIGKEYKRKGLIEVLEAMRVLKDEDIELYCISNISKTDRDNYSDVKVHHFKPKFSQSQLVRYFFLPADLFIMPTHEDTFGMVFLEALSSGLPIITTNQFAASEFVEDGKNGYFVDSDILFLNDNLIPYINSNGSIYDSIEPKLVESIVERLTYLNSNRIHTAELAKICPEPFYPEGKFSLEKRDEILTTIFKPLQTSNE